MNISEIALTLVPALGVGIAIGLIRRRHTHMGSAIALACICIALVAAVLGNLRPIVALFAWTMLMLAFVADENQRRGFAISCFSAGFLGLIVTVMYT